MRDFKNELKGIVDKTIFSCHGNIFESAFLIRYGIEEFIISGSDLLEICNSNEALSIEKLLSLSEKFDNKSTPHKIGEIQVVDGYHNRLGGYCIRNSTSTDETHLFERHFYDNLRLIDGGMPKLLASIVDIVKVEDVTRTTDILNRLFDLNPLHFDNDWIKNAYRFKMGRLLYNFVLGMNEESVWKGWVPNGGLICIHGPNCKGLGFYDQTSIGNYLITSSEMSIEGLDCCFKLVES